MFKPLVVVVVVVVLFLVGPSVVSVGGFASENNRNIRFAVLASVSSRPSVRLGVAVCGMEWLLQRESAPKNAWTSLVPTLSSARRRVTDRGSTWRLRWASTSRTASARFSRA